MLLVEVPHPDVSAAVGKDVATNKQTSKDVATVAKDVATVAVMLVIAPFALVVVAVSKVAATPAVFAAAVPLALVVAAVSVRVDTTAMLQAGQPFAVVQVIVATSDWALQCARLSGHRCSGNGDD